MLWANIIYAMALTVLGLVVGTAPGRRMLGTMAAEFAGWGMQALFYIAPTVAVSFAEAMLHTFEQDRALWAKVVGIFVDEITGGQMDDATLTAALASGGLAAAAPQLGAPLVGAVRKAIAPDIVLTPESGQENLDRLLGLTLTFGLQGWWTTAAADLVSLGKFGSASDLPDAIERGLGLSRIGRLAWRAYIKKAIEEPVTVALNRQYRFTRLPFAEAVRLWHRGYITEEQLTEAAKDAGHSDDNVKAFLNLATQEWSAEQVAKLVRYQGLEGEAAVTLLRRAGWQGDQAAQLLALYAADQGQRHREDLVTSARKLHRDGALPDDELEGYLEQAHYTTEEIALVMQADALAQREGKRLSVSELGGLLAEAKVTPEDYRARLKQWGYSDEDISLLMALRTKKLTPAQLVDAVARGERTLDQGVQALQGLGYSEADARTLLNLRARQLSPGQVLDALRQGQITPEVARVQLEHLGYADEAIDILLAFQRKQLSPADVQALLLRGELDEQAALERLVRAGYSRDDAAAIISLRVRLLTEGQILDAYGNAQIARNTAMGDLQARGLTQQDAQAVLTVFDRKAAAAAQKAAIRAAEAAARTARAAQGSGQPPQSP